MNSYRQSLYAGLIRVTANLIMIGAVFLAMYQASHWSQWPSEAVFSCWFFGITIPVWCMAFMLTRFVKHRFPAQPQSLVDLPRLGRQLVHWRVRERAAACRVQAP